MTGVPPRTPLHGAGLRRGSVPSVQYAHDGRWHVADGIGVGPEGYDAYVAHANERDGWPCWRVADASLDGQDGAPREPVREPTPWTEKEIRDLLRLSKAHMDGTIDDAGRERLRRIEEAHRFERMAPESLRLMNDIAARQAARTPGGDDR